MDPTSCETPEVAVSHWSLVVFVSCSGLYECLLYSHLNGDQLPKHLKCLCAVQEHVHGCTDNQMKLNPLLDQFFEHPPHTKTESWLFSMLTNTYYHYYTIARTLILKNKNRKSGEHRQVARPHKGPLCSLWNWTVKKSYLFVSSSYQTPSQQSGSPWCRLYLPFWAIISFQFWLQNDILICLFQPNSNRESAFKISNLSGCVCVSVCVGEC